MTNLHKHGPRAAAEFAMDKMISWRNRVQVSVDDYGDVYVRRACIGYGKDLPDSWLVGTYSRDAKLAYIVDDLKARAAELRPIYRRVAANSR